MQKRVVMALMLSLVDVRAMYGAPTVGLARSLRAHAGATSMGVLRGGSSRPQNDADAEGNAPRGLGSRRGERDVMMGWKDEGEADPAVVAAMLGLRNHGEENRTYVVDDNKIGDTIPRSPKSTSGLHEGGLAELKNGDIRKPDTDARSYRHVKLENGLSVVLVSDPEAHSAAAALCVSVGQLDDPKSVQGLAHFLEHMLFLGTEKYPEESNFDQFCAAAAGYSNAWTSLDHTMYHFIVASSKLEEALDRFASFFSCPLFSPSGTEREMKAVDSEHNKNLQDDDRREYQVSLSVENALSRLC